MSNIFKNTVLKSNPLTQYVVSIHLLIEYFLIEILKKVLPNSGSITEGNGFGYFRLVQIAEALNVYPHGFCQILKKINTIRNKFAHKISYSPSKEEIQDLLDNLKNMDNAFFISDILTEKELILALSSICGYMERYVNKYNSPTLAQV